MKNKLLIILVIFCMLFLPYIRRIYLISLYPDGISNYGSITVFIVIFTLFMLFQVKNRYYPPKITVFQRLMGNATPETNNELDLLIKNYQDDFNHIIKEILPLITKQNLYPSKDNFDPHNFHKVVIKIISLLPSTIKDQIAYNYTQMRQATQTITDV